MRKLGILVFDDGDDARGHRRIRSDSQNVQHEEEEYGEQLKMIRSMKSSPKDG
jgi:hypothetical protein